MKKVAIVAPCHIQVSKEWIAALETQKEYADIIIVDDSDGKVDLPDGFDVFGYERQRASLGDDLYEWFQDFHKSAACKQFGIWLAYTRGYKTVIVIDSDCIVPDDFVLTHLAALEMKGVGWMNPLFGTGWYSRGFPYSKREQEKWAHMGLWENELDLYGRDRIGQTDIPKTPNMLTSNGIWSAAGHFPLSGMNVAFRREAIPYMLFLPNFSAEGDTYTRHDDIWGGYIFQKIAYAKNKGLSFGAPWVFHDTVVVPEEDAEAEKPMIANEDYFFRVVDNAFRQIDIESWSASQIFRYLRLTLPSQFEGLESAFLFQEKAYEGI